MLNKSFAQHYASAQLIATNQQLAQTQSNNNSLQNQLSKERRENRRLRNELANLSSMMETMCDFDNTNPQLWTLTCMVEKIVAEWKPERGDVFEGTQENADWDLTIQGKRKYNLFVIAAEEVANIIWQGTDTLLYWMENYCKGMLAGYKMSESDLNLMLEAINDSKDLTSDGGGVFRQEVISRYAELQDIVKYTNRTSTMPDLNSFLPLFTTGGLERAYKFNQMTKEKGFDRKHIHELTKEGDIFGAQNLIKP